MSTNVSNVDLARDLVFRFLDTPASASTLSIHRLAEIGKNILDQEPGEWYGPRQVSVIIRELLNSSDNDSNNLPKVLVAEQGAIYLDEVNDLCGSDFRTIDKSSYDPLLHTKPNRWNKTSGLIILVSPSSWIVQVQRRSV